MAVERQRWYYDTHTWIPPGPGSFGMGLDSVLDERGKHGWELVQVVPQEHGKLLLIFKQLIAASVPARMDGTLFEERPDPVKVLPAYTQGYGDPPDRD